MLLRARTTALSLWRARPIPTFTNTQGTRAELRRDICSRSRETFAEKNRRLRETSEAKLADSRKQLLDDVTKRNVEMQALREAMKEKDIMLHPPPTVLYTPERSVLLPDVQVTPLEGGDPLGLRAASHDDDNSWTLLGCAGSQFAQKMVDQWMTGVSAEVLRAGVSQATQFRWLSLVEGSLLSWFRRPLLATMRYSVPEERRGSFLVHFGDSSMLRHQIQMENRYLGHVCLLDPGRKMRWHVHGSETPGDAEIKTLVQLIIREDITSRQSPRKRKRKP